jgi:hypothetical protein
VNLFHAVHTESSSRVGAAIIPLDCFSQDLIKERWFAESKIDYIDPLVRVPLFGLNGRIFVPGLQGFCHGAVSFLICSTSREATFLTKASLFISLTKSPLRSHERLRQMPPFPLPTVGSGSLFLFIFHRSFGKLDILQESLAFLPGYGIKAYPIAQDINQLYAHYWRDQAITSTCHVHAIAMGLPQTKASFPRW